jgi:acetylornithine deacetylase
MADDPLLGRTLSHLKELISFDTTSSKPNVPLLNYAAKQLFAAGAVVDWVHTTEEGKASLIARFGPKVEGGVLLSGHTDVVPVDGQAWTTDPWTLTAGDDGRLYGRGTSDMKSFSALALALTESLDPGTLSRPILIALSHDEEVGCLGAPALVKAIQDGQPAPAAVIVGEPTSMELVTAHKGVLIFRITVVGQEAHSSLTHLGVSANMEAIPILSTLRELALQLEADAEAGSPFLPKGATLTIGKLNGGTAGNILARECQILCDLRSPGTRAELIEPIIAAVRRTNDALTKQYSTAGAKLEILCDVPPLKPDPDGEAARLVRSLTGDNSPGRAVAYGAEAGYFQLGGFATAMCGPGSIDQAHQPNEFVEVSQLQKGCEFMRNLGRWLSSA